MNGLNLCGVMITQNNFEFESCLNEYANNYPEIAIWGPCESQIQVINNPVSGGQLFQLPHLEKFCKVLKVYDDALDKVAFLVDHVHMFADDSIFPQGYVRVSI